MKSLEQRSCLDSYIAHLKNLIIQRGCFDNLEKLKVPEEILTSVGVEKRNAERRH